ncbi:MAG: hypothetical protein IAI49_17075, partial [Candidatus Eremiobacteraeota bacterium]|nr:hypothetical protein [Candidatus Eremiobacteraeota bacterium]
MGDRIRAFASAAFVAALVFHVRDASAAERLLHSYSAVSLSPDASRVAAIESTDAAVDGDRAR